MNAYTIADGVAMNADELRSLELRAGVTIGNQLQNMKPLTTTDIGFGVEASAHFFGTFCVGRSKTVFISLLDLLHREVLDLGNLNRKVLPLTSPCF